MQRVNLQARVVGYDNLPPSIPAIHLRLFARVGLERQAILDHGGQGREARDAGDLDPVMLRSAGEVAQLARIRSCDENLSHYDSGSAAVSAAVPSAGSGQYGRASCPTARRDAGATVFSNTSTRTIARSEIHPPAVRSEVRIKSICTRFAPACTGTGICPVSSPASCRTCSQKGATFNRDLIFLKSSRNSDRLLYSQWGRTDHR